VHDLKVVENLIAVMHNTVGQGIKKTLDTVLLMGSSGEHYSTLAGGLIQTKDGKNMKLLHGRRGEFLDATFSTERRGSIVQEYVMLYQDAAALYPCMY
jgi:hypothetical protein